MSEDDRPFAECLARYCARNPVALERLTYDAGEQQVTYRSDKADGPTAGSETVDPLEFLARVLTHIPDKGQVTQRYYGWYANRTRGVRGRHADRRVHDAAGGHRSDLDVSPDAGPTRAHVRGAQSAERQSAARPPVWGHGRRASRPPQPSARPT